MGYKIFTALASGETETMWYPNQEPQFKEIRGCLQVIPINDLSSAD